MKIPHNFRGLLYAPSTESELAILFGLLLPYLRPPICVVEGEFQVSSTSWPDLKVKVLENKKCNGYQFMAMAYGCDWLCNRSSICIKFKRYYFDKHLFNWSDLRFINYNFSYLLQG